MMDTFIQKLKATFSLMLQPDLQSVYLAMLQKRKDDQRDFKILIQLLLIISFLVLILFFIGGITNPLYIFFYLNISFGALILSYEKGFVLLLFSMLALLIVQGLTFSQYQGMNLILLKELAPLFILQHFVLIVSWYFSKSLSDILIHQSEKMENIKQQNEKMDRLRALGALSAGFSHEFASPLNAIKIRLEQEISINPENENIKEALGAVNDCETVIQNMNDSQLDHRENVNQEISLIETLTEIISFWKVDKGNFKVEIVSKKDFILNIPPINFAQMVLNILDNSYESFVNGKLRIEFKNINQQILIIFKDNGSGFTDLVLKKWGEPFLTTKKMGTGLGLYSAKLFMESIGGDISIGNIFDSENCIQGAQIKLIFPYLKKDRV